MVALLSEKAEVQYYPEETDPDQLVQAVKELGFQADVIPDQEDCQQGKLDLIVSQLTWYMWYLQLILCLPPLPD